MDFIEYQNQASAAFKSPKRLDLLETRLCNWGLGISSEAGELAGLVKHLVFHKQGVGRMEVAKEVGDVLWYLSALCSTLQINLEDCAELNVAKLRHRHGKEFSFVGSSSRHEREEEFEDTEEYQKIRRRIEDG